ncbi:hypothetical protein Xvie_00555 [Xenorhabdus vietnamensis]|uniref:Restriction endonuclease type IV Mrr domain-containing protein n=1 Tax=Xenorhabdus vietnamensis TaxID=351656 RepID=A0A1Y2SJX2_9GAMM|nr:hypothetical protein [Xenorhabdus vietnamensis]OTA17883.1 hypothetical protein Xvie_00555 [Xenorhabdus vietnamensis]
MTTKITPRLIELVYEAVLKSFWRKNALRKFLLASYIAEKFVDSWSYNESKREFLDRLFPELQKNPKGHAVTLQMAHNLSEQTTFPDLCNWEDSKQKIQEATHAVNELKKYLKQKNEEARSEEEKKANQKRAHEERLKIQRAATDKSKLQDNLNDLHSKVGTQVGGYEFEKWFYELLDYCEITNRRPYKTGGRQIDGSLTHEGTTYIIELKFTKEQSDATDIDSLKAKVNKMADNTMGIMVSIAGYSRIAVSEASGSKTTLIIMDASHLYMFLTGNMCFKEIISRLRRHASQTGESYLPVNKFGG